MGLLSGAISGFGAGLANIGNQMMQNDAQSERDRALQMRELNLLMLREQLQDERDTKNADRKREEKEEDRRQQESKAWMRQTDDGGYEPITEGELSDLKEANQNRRIVAENQDARAYSEIEKMKQAGVKEADGGLLASAQAPTKDEQEVLDSWSEDQGKPVRIADIEARQKHKEKMEEKADEAERRKQDKADQRAWQGQQNEQTITAANQRSKEHNETMLAIKQMGLDAKGGSKDDTKYLTPDRALTAAAQFVRLAENADGKERQRYLDQADQLTSWAISQRKNPEAGKQQMDSSRLDSEAQNAITTVLRSNLSPQEKQSRISLIQKRRNDLLK